jgi:tyrosine-protein phosphatase SIW14
MNLRFARVCAVVAIPVTLLVPALTLAESPSECRIKNFGRVNDIMYRGAQPDKKDYPVLAHMGIKTVIDLQREGEDNEQGLVEAAGMRFYRIPMSDSDHPKHEQIEQFLKLVTDPENQPVFIHCHGGRHRTGATIAIYRMAYEGWDFDRAFAEMKQYEFTRGFGHGALKDCVYDHAQHIAQVTAASASPANNSHK